MQSSPTHSANWRRGSHVAVAQATVCLAGLYRLSKDHADRLRPAFDAIESAVKDVVDPIYKRFHGMPLDDTYFIYLGHEIQSATGSKLIGCGSAITTLSISNDNLSKIVEMSDECIAARTGIRNRRVLSGDEALHGLSIQATQRALEMAQGKAEDVDLVLLCTSTPDDLFGGVAQVLCDTYLSISTFVTDIMDIAFWILFPYARSLVWL